METDDAEQLDFFEALDGNRGTTQDGNPADDWDAYVAARITACKANRRRMRSKGGHLPAPPLEHAADERSGDDGGNEPNGEPGEHGYAASSAGVDAIYSSTFCKVVSVIVFPERRRSTSFPSLTALRPNVDALTP